MAGHDSELQCLQNSRAVVLENAPRQIPQLLPFELGIREFQVASHDLPVMNIEDIKPTAKDATQGHDGQIHNRFFQHGTCHDGAEFLRPLARSRRGVGGKESDRKAVGS
jgi:hypothetical protein